MSIFSRKTSVNILLLSINLILLAIISRVVIADETTNAILEQSIYLYYYESDDELLNVGESQLYTFAPIPGEDITIVSYGLDDAALTSISLFDSTGNQVGTGTSNQVTEKPADPAADTPPQSPFITAIQHTANNSGLYYFEVKNESGQEGLIRTMLFVGEPFNTDLTLIDELNPLLPSKAFMVAGDPDREWKNELTGETIQGLRTEIDVLPIERIDRAPDVFLSYSTLTYLPNVAERLQPVTFDRWFNEDDQEIYLVNIRPIPEQETVANRTILENIDYQTYNSNNFFFFEYLFSVGNGSDPIALDRGAGACAGLADRIDCVSSDPNLGRDTDTDTAEIIIDSAVVEVVTSEIVISGEQITVTSTGQTCSSFYGNGEIFDIGVANASGTSQVCVPNSYTNNDIIIFDGSTVSGTDVDQQNVCLGTDLDDLIACTTGNDFITALAGDDAIFASGGDDIIYGNGGSDFIVAGDGNDIAYGGDDNDGISGGAGDDILSGEGGADRIEGDAGNDTISGGADNDVLLGGAGNDTLNGGAASAIGGSLSISGTGASISNDPPYQFVYGGTGEDTIIIDDSHTSGDNALSLIAGNEYADGTLTAVGDNEQDTYSFEGNPTGYVYIGAGNEDILDFTSFGSAVNMQQADYIDDGGLIVYIYGGEVVSNISGSDNGDTFLVSSCFFCSTIPDYTIDGNGGADTITTGSGADTIDGGTGGDTINAGAGNDTIDGGDGADTIDAGAGNDTIDAGAGNDTIDGGAGTDFIDESTESNALIVTLNNATGTIEDTVTGEIDNVSNVENIDTGSGDDQFFISDTDDNIIDASSGDDEATVSGGSGIILVDRTGDVVDVTDSGGGIGTDEFSFVETINILGSIGNDIVLVSDENDNTITGNGGSDIVLATKNTAVSGTVTITRTGTDVNVSGTGFGTDLYEAISTVNVTGSTDDDTFELTDENDNTITGNGGTDTVNVYSTASSIEDETITITRSGDNVTVTSVISGSGGSGIGNDAYNDIDQVNITAGGGDDTFEMFDSLDNILDGGAGTDTVNYASITGGLTIILDPSGTAISGTGIGTDLLINIENINGGNGDDTFVVEDEGDNAIDGGGGTDEATSIMENVYSGVITIIRDPANVVTVSGNGFGTDVYTNIEKVNVESSSGDDVFRPSDDQDNDFDAGSGTDWIDYSTITGSVSVVVDLSTGSATGDGSDSLTGFENISGSIGNDTLTGDSSANIIDGYTGDDTIDGGGGDDTLIGNTGDDDIDGGSGTDTFDESNATTAMDVTLVSGNGSSTSTGQGSDTLTSIENINTGSGDDTFSITDSNDNIINANGGDDVATILGGSGTLTITRSGSDVDVSDTGGGIGTDEYNNVEQVNVSGSTGNDIFVVSDANDNELNGLGGTDSIDYATTSEDILVNFINTSTAEVSGISIGTDTLINFEEISTDSGNDDFIFNSDVGTVTINSRAGDDDFDFDDASGTLTLSDSSGNTFLDFTDYTDGAVIDLGSTSQQTVSLSDSSLLVTLNGTFNNVSGSAFADNINGTTSVDTIYGGDSADSIGGDDNDDFLYGEAGADIIDGGAGDDTIYGGDDADTLSGGDDNDTIDGGAGADTLNGDAGDDTLNGGDGIDTLNGGAGDDTLSGGDGNDTLDGGADTDLIDESAETNALVVTLNNGAGTIVDSTAVETDNILNVENINTGSALDTFFISDSDNNIINAGGDDDVATIFGGSGTITITRSGNDVDVSDTGGGIGTDEYNSVIQVNISGSITDDTFIVSDANDNILDGGDGDDTISYASLTTPITVTIVDSQTTISATGIGADTLYSIENIFTGTGDDYFDINGTVDYGLNSNTGADTFFFNVSVDGTLALETSDSAHLDFSSFTSTGITIDLSDATSQGVTGSLDITLTGTFTTISGTTFADSISGTTVADTIWADDGADIIFGDAGADTITGGAGNDIIDGGADTDTFDESNSTSDFTIVMDSTSGTSSSAVEGTDTLTGIENINTGSGDDDFTLGDSGVNVIDAANGTDTVTILNAETVTITRVGDDVFVTDGSTTVGNDEYYSVEQVNISGTSGDDVFTMNDEFDNIINGQGGTNEVDYSLVTAVINVNSLSTGTTILSTGIGTDTLIDIQNITTGDGDDTFVIEDNSVDNIFDADDGTDTATYTASGTISATNSGSSVIVQISGSDTDQLDNFENVNFVGDTTDDTFVIQDSNDNNIDGSSGNDTYDASFATNDITVNVNSSVTVVGTDVGTDTLVSIENIITGDGDDTFIIDTSVGGTFTFDAGEATVGNIFQFTGDGSAATTITITGSSTATDELDFSQFTGGAIDIDLSDTSQQTVDGGNLFITFNEFIDDVTGTDNGDTIAGNDLDNTIDGGAGDDTILYSAGDDTIDGGADTDTVDYTGAPDSITATLTSSTITVAISGTSDSQTITNTEVINGTASDDTIIISEAVSTTVNAAGGTDVVDYSGLTDAINIDLSTGTGNVSGTSSSDDHTLNDVEDVIGSNFDDTIVGNSSDNDLDGGSGDDFIQGNTGDDTIDGGSGSDTVSYQDAGSSVNVDLESGSSSGGDGNDTLTSIENVSGSAFADNISGSSETNVIYGGDGADTIYGNEGDDEIYGEAGADTLYGGSLNPTSGTSDGSDTIYGGDDNDTIYGGNDNTNGSDASDADDTIDGGAGDDTIYGGNDNGATGSGDDAGDTIEGGNGDDTIYGGNDNTGGGSGDDGNDTITDVANGTGNDDNDTIYGDNNNTGGGTGDGGDDIIDVQEGEQGGGNEDDVVGDNDGNIGGTGSDTITSDQGPGNDDNITDDNG